MKDFKYTKDGVNKKTYQILFGAEKEEGKKECSKEIFTIEMSSFYSRKLSHKLSNIIQRLMDMYFYDVNYFNIHKNVFNKGYTFKNSDIKFEFDYLEKYLKRILKNEDSYVKRNAFRYEK